jgi:hypothetical protein
MMSPAQDLHDRLKAIAEEFKGTPGIAYPLIALGGILGHLRAGIKKGVYPAPAVEAPIAEPVVAEAPAPVIAPAKPAPAVQVAKPKPAAS